MKFLKRDFITPLLSKLWAIPSQGYRMQINDRLYGTHEDEVIILVDDDAQIIVHLDSELLTYVYRWDKRTESLIEKSVKGWF